MPSGTKAWPEEPRIVAPPLVLRARVKVLARPAKAERRAWVTAGDWRGGRTRGCPRYRARRLRSFLATLGDRVWPRPYKPRGPRGGADVAPRASAASRAAA